MAPIIPPMLAGSETTTLVDAELGRDEHVLWRGMPDSSRWLYPQDAVLIPFSVMWGGFAIFWEASVLTSPKGSGGAVFDLWGSRRGGGLYLIFGRFFVRRWMRRRTLYAVTDRRALLISPTFRGGRQVTSVWLGAFPPLEKRIGRSGRGTIWVGTFRAGQRLLAGDGGWPGGGRAIGN